MIHETTHFRLVPRLGALALLLTPLFLAGCGNGFDQRLLDARATVGDIGLADRCAAILQRGYPGGNITVTDKQAAIVPGSANLATILAQVSGTRADIPAQGFIARDIAADCRFQNGILVEFHWTKGPFNGAGR